MERSAHGSTTIKTQSARRPARAGSASNGALEKTNPRSRALNRSTRAAHFAAFADDVRRDLNPRGPLEAVMTDHVIQAAWRLRSTLDRESSRAFDDANPSVLPIDPPKRASASAADRAARSVKEAIESLDTVRLIRKLRDRPEANPEPASPEAEAELFAEIAPNEWPIVPVGDEDETEVDPETEDEPAEGPTPWRDRLAFDFDVSETSPVIKGTWITVGHVISLIVDGETWADILRSHPELTEADIRICLAYTLAEDDLAG